MLVFIDESGDSGLEVERGSSSIFAVGLVVFEDAEEAEACDKRVELLKHELGWRPDSEFHFARNSNRVREAFLKAVAPYQFFYYGFVLFKTPSILKQPIFQNKLSFYQYVAHLVFESAKEKLENAIVVMDRSGSETFRSAFTTYLKRKMNEMGIRRIKKIKMQESDRNNLLQLADYIASIVGRSAKKEVCPFRQWIAHREMEIRIWPK